MKSKLPILTTIAILLTACDYESKLIIDNNRTETIQIKTDGNPIQEYGNLKLLSEGTDAYLYELKEDSEHCIIQLINEDISTDNMPYSRLEIYTSSDTMIFEDQNAIVDNMTMVYENYFKITVD